MFPCQTRGSGFRLFGREAGGLFLDEMLGFADFAAGFAHATFEGAFGFHAAIANQTSGFLLGVAFKFFCGSARSVSATCFHNNAKCRAAPQEASGVNGVLTGRNNLKTGLYTFWARH